MGEGGKSESSSSYGRRKECSSKREPFQMALGEELELEGQTVQVMVGDSEHLGLYLGYSGKLSKCFI